MAVLIGGSTAWASVQPVHALSDLTVRVMAVPSFAAAGESVSIIYEVTNVGSTRSPKSDLSVWLGLPPRSLVLARSMIPELDSGGKAIGSLAVPMPRELASGRYVVGVTINAGKNFPEVGFTNNTEATSILIASAGGQAYLSWDANKDGATAGYRVYVGTRSRTYTEAIDVGSLTAHRITGITGVTYFFAVKAYDAAGNESAFSEEVAKMIH